jgi:hypothetical protein
VTVHGPINPAVKIARSLRETRAVLARIEAGRLRPGTPFELSHAIVSALTRHQEAYVETVTSDVWQLEQRVTGGSVGDPEEFLNELFRALSMRRKRARGLPIRVVSGPDPFNGHPRSVGCVPGEDVHHGRHGKAAAAPPGVHAGVQGRDRRGLPSGDRSMRQVAKDFDLTETAVRDWVRQADLDAGTRTDGLTSTERDELARLRRENRRLTEDVEILKRATAFFAKETR